MVGRNLDEEWQHIQLRINKLDMELVLKVTRREFYIDDQIQSPLDPELDYSASCHWIDRISMLVDGLVSASI